jgi:hypothetical protein
VEQGRGVDTGSVIASTGNSNEPHHQRIGHFVRRSRARNGISSRFSAGDSIGSATFGSLHGTRFFSPGFITAVNTIGTVTVVDSAEFFHILAGYDSAARPVNSAAKINKVMIGTTVRGYAGCGHRCRGDAQSYPWDG